MENKNDNFLGLDWGENKIGVSFADNETKMAFAVKTLKNSRRVFAELAEIVSDKEVGTVVIGIPKYDVVKNSTVFAPEKIGEKIRKKMNVRIEYQDEMFSTKIAERNLREKGLKNIGKIDDAESARIILESWLNKKFNI